MHELSASSNSPLREVLLDPHVTEDRTGAGVDLVRDGRSERSEMRQVAQAPTHGTMAKPGGEAVCDGGALHPTLRPSPSALARSWILLGIKLGSGSPST